MKFRTSKDHTKRMVRTGSRVTVYSDASVRRFNLLSDTTHKTVRAAKAAMTRG